MLSRSETVIINQGEQGQIRKDETILVGIREGISMVIGKESRLRTRGISERRCKDLISFKRNKRKETREQDPHYRRRTTMMKNSVFILSHRRKTEKSRSCIPIVKSILLKRTTTTTVEIFSSG